MEDRSTSAVARYQAPGWADFRVGQTQTKTNSLANQVAAHHETQH
jgi:hypothetical protein